MTLPVVLIADKLAESTVAALGDQVEVRWVDGPDRPKLLEAVADADALLVRSATTVDAEVLAAAPKLKIVARAGVGLDNVDVDAATARGVLVVSGDWFFPGLAAGWSHTDECLRLTYSQDEAEVRRGIALIADEIRRIFPQPEH